MIYSQMIIFLSLSHDASWSLAPHEQHETGPLWPARTATSLALCISQTCTLPDEDPAAMYCPSGLGGVTWGYGTDLPDSGLGVGCAVVEGITSVSLHSLVGPDVNELENIVAT